MSEEAPQPTKESRVTLRPLDEDSVRAFCKLSVREDQNQFVAPNAISVAQAHFSKNAWFRGVYADEAPVGFVMLYDDPAKPEYFLWRFMIDQRYQKFGFGRKAIELLIAHVLTRPRATELLTSCVPGEGSPKPFYEGLGFIDTGKVDEGEVVLRLDLSERAAERDAKTPAFDPADVGVVLKAFDKPDETKTFPKGKFETVQLGGKTFGRATYQPGWKWSVDVGPEAGKPLCDVAHLGMVVSGHATAAFGEGRVVELSPGDLFEISSEPHDSWVVGDEPYVSIHFLGAESYAR